MRRDRLSVAGELAMGHRVRVLLFVLKIDDFLTHGKEEKLRVKSGMCTSVWSLHSFFEYLTFLESLKKVRSTT